MLYLTSQKWKITHLLDVVLMVFDIAVPKLQHSMAVACPRCSPGDQAGA
jgi:hypothetical protein